MSDSRPYVLSADIVGERLTISLQRFSAVLDSLVGGVTASLFAGVCGWATVAALRKFSVSEALPILVLSAPGGLLAIAWLLAGKGSVNTFSRVDWDRSGGVVRLGYSGFQLFQKELSLPYHDIRSVGFEFNDHGAVTLVFSLTNLREPVWLRVSLEDIAQKQTLLRLAFRIARVMGLTTYSIRHNDALGLSLVLPSDAKYSAEALPVPRLEEEDAYPEPLLKVEPFVPREYPGLSRICEWTPGKLVRLSISASESLTSHKAWNDFYIGALIGLTLGLCGLPWLGTNGFLAIMIGALSLGLASAFASSSGEREVIIDWELGLLVVRSGGEERRIPLSDVKGLILSGSSRMTIRRGHSSLYYRCFVEADLGGSTELLAETREDLGKEQVYRSSLSLAAELAAALKVPWRWEGRMI